MGPSIFLSHSSKDEPFVSRLAYDLANQDISYWLDKARIKTGASLIKEIRDGIDKMDYLAVILSPDSVASPWVQREVDVAMNQEILGRKIKVLPIMYRKCDLPGFLVGKLYADFTDEANYAAAFQKLVEDLGVVFNRHALFPPGPSANLGRAIDSAWKGALSVLSQPFHRPFQYIGMPIQKAVSATGGAPNDVGNIILDTEECHMLLEAEGNFINYVDVELKWTAPHFLTQEFDSELVLGALSLSPGELELVRRQVHCHTYYDHRKKLKVSVSCLYDGAPLSVGFSSKYYGI